MGKIYSERCRFFGAVFLIAGTSIGASELGLPVVLRFAGYLPAVVGMLFIYVCMLVSGILLSRLFVANREHDLPTLFQKYLGNVGATLFNISYFALAFCLLIAYWSGLSGVAGSFPFGFALIAIASILTYYGLRRNLEFLCAINFVLTGGLILSFIFITFASLRGGEISLMRSMCWSQLPKSLPIILCSYGYHQVVPMICRQLDYNVKSINRALFIGTLFPLIFNIVITTIGFRLFSIEELSRAAELGLPVFVLLKQHFNSIFFMHAGRCFSLFAMATSLLGVSMATRGALLDIFRGRKLLEQSVELLIMLPLFIALVNPRLFFAILGIAGGIFGNFIAGLLPVSIFLKSSYFRFRYLLLWCVFAAIFAIECTNLLTAK
jgi:tyrosine-specific transport protein